MLSCGHQSGELRDRNGERVIAEARRNNQPACIVVPSDYALSPIVSADVRPIVPRSNPAALQKAMAAIAERIKDAKSVVAFPAFTISRIGLQKQAQRAIEALGCPFATTLMEKCLIDEGHPQFAGMYVGAVSEKTTRQIVEGADLVLTLAPWDGSEQTLLSSYSTTTVISLSARWRKTRTGLATTSRLGSTPNCRRRWDAQIGTLRV
jgi:TPP-dependent 2-oxoacid decarboxylase